MSALGSERPVRHPEYAIVNGAGGLREPLAAGLHRPELEIGNMKSGTYICPACHRSILTEVASGAGYLWHCANQDCGRNFSPEQLFPLDSGVAFRDADGKPADDRLQARERYRIPTTAEAQVYELRRMFRL